MWKYLGENTVKHNSCDKILGKNILRGQFTFELGEVRRNKIQKGGGKERRKEGLREGRREGGRKGGKKGGEDRKKEGIPSFLI